MLLKWERAYCVLSNGPRPGQNPGTQGLVDFRGVGRQEGVHGTFGTSRTCSSLSVKWCPERFPLCKLDTGCPPGPGTTAHSVTSTLSQRRASCLCWELHGAGRAGRTFRKALAELSRAGRVVESNEIHLWNSAEAPSLCLWHQLGQEGLGTENHGPCRAVSVLLAQRYMAESSSCKALMASSEL